MAENAIRDIFVQEWAEGGFFYKARLRVYDPAGGDRVMRKLHDLHGADLTGLDSWQRLRIVAVIWELPSLANAYIDRCVKYGGADRKSFSKLTREMTSLTRSVIDRLSEESPS
jgi:hypothetical protein